MGKAFASPRRLELLDLLAQAPRTVDELARASDQSTRTPRSTCRRSTPQAWSRARARVRACATRSPATRRCGSGSHSATPRSRAWPRSSAPRATTSARTSRRSAATSFRPAAQRRCRARRRPPAEEFEAGHIEGARSIPIDGARAPPAELPADREVVAYCRGPFCAYAHEAVRHLRATAARRVASRTAGRNGKLERRTRNHARRTHEHNGTTSLDTTELEQRVKTCTRRSRSSPSTIPLRDRARLAERLGYPADRARPDPGGSDRLLRRRRLLPRPRRLQPGEQVVDLGSGSGTDASSPPARTGADGQVIGVDMTDAQLAKARRLAADARFANVEFREGLHRAAAGRRRICRLRRSPTASSTSRPTSPPSSPPPPARCGPAAGSRSPTSSPRTASRRRHLRRRAVGGLHRRRHAARRATATRSRRRLRDRDLAREHRVPVRLRSRRQRHPQVRRHEHLAARPATLTDEETTCWGPRGD